MPDFETLIEDLAGRLGLGAAARPLTREGVALLFNGRGGLSGLLDRFRTAGLSSVVSSWIGGTNAAALPAAKIEEVLGTDVVSGIASGPVDPGHDVDHRQQPGVQRRHLDRRDVYR